MIITNKKNLPEGYMKFLKPRESATDMGKLTATQILKGVKEIILEKRHWGQYEVDAVKFVWAVFGSAVHSLLEHEGDQEITEERLHEEIEGIHFSGQLDCYNMRTEVITDWKSSVVWKIIFGDYEDWRKQGAIYAWLLKKAGFGAKKFIIEGLLKDHSAAKARHDRNYPQDPMFNIEFIIESKDIEEIEAFIFEKIRAYKENLKLEDDEIEPCTIEERWEKPAKWAVMKNGRKSAVRLLDSKDEALELAKTLGNGHYLEERKNEPKKCLDYCHVKQFCNFYRRWIAENPIEQK